MNAAQTAGPPATAGPLILLIEDEASLRRYLRPSLKSHGYRLLEAATGSEGIAMARQHVPDLVLLDLGLPDMDGMQVTRSLREWSQAPILILSARGLETDKVEALDAGADDYLTKPFGFPELVARIRAALRRAAGRAARGASRVIVAGPLAVDLESRRVTLAGKEVRLTAIEYRLLATLAEHAGRVVTYRTLLLAVWGPGHAGQLATLRVFMAHLRRKLETDVARPRIFETDTGVGYRLRVPAE